ncbi:hypothetical protein RhiirA5_411214 [Rhizophagus irregularis]|uniref:Btb/poz domain-containing protein 19-like n=2 Tax=Rhizophagus irregularis TaxID=588596 RepID=A0A2I1EVH9_9GLOM|nr:hypothetical protein RhiirA5_411214 [Rhizophagus irregularis]PKC63301.1 hypothetical protein RhiirA1_519562 [Rhizophagus irregularis]PKY26133.1 hypothetical protein RhiirB3_441333 [Rhizophagus irregularis]CAB4474044.1 unnamed protein product [Rhizophagus irregularis]CAB5184144.1 unnamed protein product [Rhizophagus irregularis]
MIPLPSDKKFIQDISQIRKNNIDYDVVFIVGRKPSKRMIGHSFVLKVRSVYFHNKLHSMDENEEFDKYDRYQFKFPEYTFEIFDRILSFIYSNEINVLTMSSLSLLNLMKAAKRFKLTDMVEYLQSYLIEDRSSWIYENIFTEAFDNEESQQLQSLVIDLICKNTKWFLNLDHFNKFSEEQLIKFLQIDDLSIEEFHVWNAVLDWAFVKNADLNEKKVTLWSVQEIECFKKTLKPFIPFIRFFQISSSKYFDYVYEFSKVLPEELVNKLLEYYLKGNSPTNYLLLPLRKVRTIDSDFITSEQAEIISCWIENDTQEKLINLEWEFKFNLLYSTKRNGNSVEMFHEYCDNKGATVILVKTNLPGEIIGGYNPISWGNNESSSDFKSKNSFKDLLNDGDENSLTDVDEELIVGSSSSASSQKMALNGRNDSSKQADSFLFSFNMNNENNIGKISSFNVLNSVHNCHECGPCFGTTDLWITPDAAHLKYHTVFHQPLKNSGYHRQGSYEIKLRNKPGAFQFKDYEVFQVIHV